MSYAPCENPNCPSFGKPHPNCRCSVSMAEGGPVPEPAPSPLPAINPNEVVMDKEIPADQVVMDKPEEIPADQVVMDSDKYNTPGQLDLAQVEATARGIAGPFATAAELGLSKLGIPGLSAEEQAGRKNTYPEDAAGYEAFGQVAGLGMGAGVAGMIGKISTESKILQAAIQSGLFQTSDEISNAMLGQGDPEHPVGYALAHIGAAGLAGGLVGAGAGLVDKGITGAASLAAKANSPETWEKIGSVVTRALSDAVAAAGLYKHGNVMEALLGGPSADKIAKLIGKYIGKPVSRGLQKVIMPVVIKAIGDGTPEVIDLQLAYHAENIARGLKSVNNGVEKLFGPASQQAVNYLSDSKARDRLEDWITGGGINQNIQQEIYDQNAAPEKYAQGGEVSVNEPVLHGDQSIAKRYPNQNMLLNTARGRVSQYLNSLRPQPHVPKLAFDPEPDVRSQRKSYEKALDIAVRPLSVLDELHRGTIDTEHVKHFNAMFPEINKVVQGQISKKIADGQLKGEKPNYKIRQGLSLFTGTNLSSAYLPQSIQTIQNVFAKKDAEHQVKPLKGNPGKLSKSEQSFQTGSQSLVRRSQKI